MRRAGGSRVPAWVWVILCAIGFIAVYLVSNVYVPGRSWENSLLGRSDNESLAGLVARVLPVLPLRAPRETLIIGVGIAGVVCLVRRRWREAIVVVLGSGIAVAGSQIFKNTAGRPNIETPVWGPSTASFPSGHLTLTLVVALSLLVAVPAAVRVWLAPVLLAWCAWIAGSIQALDWHRPSDVIGAVLLTGGAFFLMRCFFPVPRTAPVRLQRADRLSATVSVVLVVLSATLSTMQRPPQATGLIAAAVVAVAMIGFGIIARRVSD